MQNHLHNRMRSKLYSSHHIISHAKYKKLQSNYNPVSYFFKSIIPEHLKFASFPHIRPCFNVLVKKKKKKENTRACISFVIWKALYFTLFYLFQLNFGSEICTIGQDHDYVVLMSCLSFTCLQLISIC